MLAVVSFILEHIKGFSRLRFDIRILRSIRYRAMDLVMVVQELLPGHIRLAPDGHHLFYKSFVGGHGIDAISLIRLLYVLLVLAMQVKGIKYSGGIL